MCPPLSGYRSLFSPYELLAESLLEHSGVGDDGSHDIAHLARVWKNARAIQAAEGGDAEIIAAAVLLHDCVAVEKNSALRSQASRLAAEKAGKVLRDLGWSEPQAAATAHSIEAHSFSAGIAPRTLEARIVQDADRLDAIGMIGVARCFYVAGRLGHALYDPLDPMAGERPLDDRFAADHFQTKLLKLAAGFQTATGAVLAGMRQARLKRFLDEFMQEVQG